MRNGKSKEEQENIQDGQRINDNGRKNNKHIKKKKKKKTKRERERERSHFTNTRKR